VIGIILRLFLCFFYDFSIQNVCMHVCMYEGRLKSNAHMLVERERNDLQKRARWHVEVIFPLNMHAQV
jgi:hypothetical protein